MEFVYFDALSNGCRIYENRPNICNELQEKYELDRSFKINIIGE